MTTRAEPAHSEGSVTETPMVRIRDVHKDFGEAHVLQGIDLTVERGQVLCIIGPSGSGKSTLLRCVNALESPSSGLVEVDGERIGVEDRDGVLYELPPARLSAQRAQIGMVFQGFHLFPNRSALDNVMEGPLVVQGISRDEAREHALDLLGKVGLADHVAKRPSQLSGGQQQRVAIARALAMRPKLMLFDEPTSALDPELVGDVLDVIRRLAQTGMTMMVVTHEMAFAREVGDVVAVMDHGRVVEVGPAEQVMTRPQNPRACEFLMSVQ
jgi:polar amino acid transport system ATP-binding protein